ncbi:MAG: sulfite exporter TauE/SafE family protein, partial [bacterium]|nr:sulfite exporter TauE/SafE family protein [bacterium]
PAELWIVRSSWSEIAWKGVTRICIGLAVGVPLGTWLLGWGEPRFLLVILGGFLILTGIVFLGLRPSWSLSWPAWVAPAVGMVSGVLAGLFGTGGPPVIVYYQLSGVVKASFRGNLMAIFLVITLVRLPSCAIAGLITTPRLLAALAVLPAVLAGAWLGNRIHLQIEEITFRRMVSVALIAIGVLLVV